MNRNWKGDVSFEAIEARSILRSGFDSCWWWVGPMNQDGYGLMRVAPYRGKTAHRTVYELLRGPIPAGKQIDHLCRNRRCVNPDHLEPVTQRENVLRGLAPTAENARKTHCLNGHEFTQENTYRQPSGRGCRECKRRVAREWARRNPRKAKEPAAAS